MKKYIRRMPKKSPNSKKEFRQYCTVMLILLLCVVFYAICMHWNLFGIKDSPQENPLSETKASEAKTNETQTHYQYEINHVVAENETLWAIAGEYHPGEDTRKIVYEIRKANASRSGEKLDPKIIPGQVIKVPK